MTDTRPLAISIPEPRSLELIFTPEDRKALRVMELDIDADRKALRMRYTALLRRYHPDHNGGDRSHERALQAAIEAYGHLKKAAVFA